MNGASRRERGRPRHRGIITPGEARVLERLRLGLTNAQIAAELGMSVNGVKFHVSSLMSKLDRANRRELAAWRGGEPVMHQPADTDPTADRTVRFPDDESIGSAFVRDWGADDRPEPYWEVRHSFGHWQRLGPARGAVIAPAGSELGLLVDEGKSDHPWLAALGPEDVQVLRAGRDSRGRPALGPISHWSGLRQLVIGGIEQMDDADLAPLAGFRALHHLLLAGAGEIDAGFAALARLPRFRELVLVDLATMPRGDPAGAPGLHLRDRTFEHFAAAPGLRILDLINVHVERSGLERLRRASGLERLRITNLRAEDADLVLEPVAVLPVRELSFEGCRSASDETLHRVAAAHDAAHPLVALEVHHTRASDAGLAPVLDGPWRDEIRVLFVGGSRVTEASLDAIAGLPALHTLDLRGLSISDAGVATLAAASQLRHLNLGENPVTDAGVKSLTTLSRLRTLNVEGTRISARGIATLEDALPDCEIVQGHRVQLIAAARAQFATRRA